MQIAVGAVVGLALVVLLVGAVTGRVRLTSCCSPADPSNDLRMRVAFEPDRDDVAVPAADAASLLPDPTGRRTPRL